MRLNFILLAFFVSSLAISESRGQEGAAWVQSGEGDSTLTFIDANSLKFEPIGLVGWLLLYNNDTNFKVDGRVLGYSLGKVAWDCSGRKTQTGSLAFYDRSGKPILSGSSEFSQYNWREVFPESIAERELNTACNLAPIRGDGGYIPKAPSTRRLREINEQLIATSIAETIAYAKQMMPWTASPQLRSSPNQSPKPSKSRPR